MGLDSLCFGLRQATERVGFRVMDGSDGQKDAQGTRRARKEEESRETERQRDPTVGKTCHKIEDT